MSWSEEQVSRLAELWAQGYSASAIGKAIGVSKNAVIGKAHRLGLKSRPSPVKANEPKPAPARPKEVEARPTPTKLKAKAPALQDDDEPENERPSSAGDIPSQPVPNPASDRPRVVSVGPGGFLRQGPGDQQAPIPPAPPRRLVPAKPSPEMADKTSLLELNERVCRWPMGHPGEADFHFCTERALVGKPYCAEHTALAYVKVKPRAGEAA